jgi:hypothetical protein
VWEALIPAQLRQVVGQVVAVVADIMVALQEVLYTAAAEAVQATLVVYLMVQQLQLVNLVLFPIPMLQVTVMLL